MREVCFRGRVGEVEDRKPVTLDSGGREAPACPDLGDLARVNRLST